MSAKKMTESEVDNVLDGLTGPLRVGQKYYVLSLPFHFIGTVESITEKWVVLERGAEIVMNAGSASDAVSKIIAGKQQPEAFECPDRRIIVSLPICAAIPF